LFWRGFTSNSKRHCVFASEQGLDLMARRKHWFGDGTFRVVPGLFYQLYTIQVQWKNSQKTVPVVYVLMSGKRAADYVEVFEFLKVCCYLISCNHLCFRLCVRRPSHALICPILNQRVSKRLNRCLQESRHPVAGFICHKASDVKRTPMDYDRN
jgi:hypothetical protein